MTGFGAAQAGDLRVEVSSVNGRGVSVKARLSEALAAFHPLVEAKARERLHRGTLMISVSLRARAGGRRAHLNAGALAAYAKEFALARKRLPSLPAVDWATLAALPGVMDPPPEEAGLERLLSKAMDQALKALMGDRAREGRALVGHCRRILDAAEKSLALAASRREGAREVLSARLQARLGEALSRAGLSGLDDGMRRELVLHAERGDVAEELERLRVHIAEARRTLAGAGPAGRRLDFLAQEMLREANTLGSKSQDPVLTHAVIDLKTALDRFKEQVQNLE